jgi:hypothetical protein
MQFTHEGSNDGGLTGNHGSGCESGDVLTTEKLGYGAHTTDLLKNFSTMPSVGMFQLPYLIGYVPFYKAADSRG